MPVLVAGWHRYGLLGVDSGLATGTASKDRIEIAGSAVDFDLDRTVWDQL